MGITIHGATGRLTYGSRLVASFTEWELTDLPGQRRGIVRARFTHRDLAYWGGPGPFQVRLDMGPGRALRGVARVQAEEPLELIVEELHDG